MSRDEVYLRHTLDAMGKIESYVSSGRDAFFASAMSQDAVLRQLEVIGEAVKQPHAHYESTGVRVAHVAEVCCLPPESPSLVRALKPRHRKALLPHGAGRAADRIAAKQHSRLRRALGRESPDPPPLGQGARVDRRQEPS